MMIELERGAFGVSTDPTRLDRAAVGNFLSRSYWAEGIPAEVLDRAIAGSICFGLYDGDRQIGFARAVTDRATFAYLADVYVLEPYRGRGLASWMMSCILAHPDLQGLRRWSLVTRDAQGLYARFGFRALARPERHMEIHDPEVYQNR
jgi:GNAT superfamily N-acetyltransferase